MAYIPDPLNSEDSKQILCCYVNATSQLQIARIRNIPNGYLERMVFPGQRLLFKTPPQAELEIHTSAVLADAIPCAHLRVKEKTFQQDS